MLAGWHLGLVPALVAAVAGVLWSGYFFYSPFYSYFLARPNEILNLLLFMVVARGDQPSRQLDEAADRARPQARERDERSLRLLAPAGGGALGGRNLSRDRGARRQPGAAQGRSVRRPAAARSDRRRKTRRAASACAPPSPRSGAARTPATTVDDGAGNIWFMRRVSERTPDFGVIAIDLGSVPADKIGGNAPAASTRRWRTPPPRSSGSTSRAPSTKPRCARRPSCCARR